MASFYLYWTQSVDLKSFRFGFETFPCFLMVSVSVSKKIWSRKKYRYRFRKILVSKKVSVSISKNFAINKSIGIGFDFFWYRKKYRYRFRKNLVSKKVSILVSEKIWYRKKYRIRYRKKLVSEKSFGFGFAQILGFVTHCPGQRPSPHTSDGGEYRQAACYCLGVGPFPL